LDFLYLLTGLTAGAEVIIALQVNESDLHNWFFSGDPSRNGGGYAQMACFLPTDFPDGVPGDTGMGVVPQTVGRYLFGFEHVHYIHNDWDFDSSIFAIDQGTVGPPEEVVPEPAK
jgi:hypothetical protein